MQQFRFVPEARLDDLMISFATDQGGVGPHFDSYDVFLLQAHGRRRWRIGRQKDLSLQPDVPLKVLSNFEPEEEFVLEPDRKSTRLNSSHLVISYAVFCLKKKNKHQVLAH